MMIFLFAHFWVIFNLTFSFRVILRSRIFHKPKITGQSMTPIRALHKWRHSYMILWRLHISVVIKKCDNGRPLTELIFSFSLSFVIALPWLHEHWLLRWTIAQQCVLMVHTLVIDKVGAVRSPLIWITVNSNLLLLYIHCPMVPKQ